MKKMPIINKIDIAKLFFKDAVWIDNEIIDCVDATLPDRALRHHFSFFVGLSKEFHNRGINCSLCTFRESFDDDPYAQGDDEERACKIAKQSDLVILDWHLQGDDCSSCLRILEQLEMEKGVHFVLIFTKEASSEVHRVLIQKKYRRLKHGSQYANYNNSVFLVVVPKKDFEMANDLGVTADALISNMGNLLIELYPDALRWSAISAAALIKRFIPQWLSYLPEGTDLGVAVEYCIQKQKGESGAADTMRQMLLKNILDDLEEVVLSNSDEIISDEIFHDCFSQESKLFNEKLRLEVEKLPKREKKQAASYTIKDKLDDDFVSRLLKFQEKNQIDVFNKCICSSIALAEYFERVSGPIPDRILRGNIYKSFSEETILLCITQACDCVRSQSLLMLVCKSVVPPLPNNAVFFRCDKAIYQIALRVTSLRLCLRVDLEDHAQYECIGRLRASIIDNLAHQYISHITRVGVDIPSYERDLRKI